VTKPYGRATAWLYLVAWPCAPVGIVAFIPSGFAAWSGIMLIVGVVGLIICIQTAAATTAARKSHAGWQLDRWRWKLRFATGWEIPSALRVAGILTAESTRSLR